MPHEHNAGYINTRTLFMLCDLLQEYPLGEGKKLHESLALVFEAFCVSSKTIIMANPLLHLSTGALYLKECPAQRLLPIYLIVSGVFSLISGSSSSWNRYASSTYGNM